MKFSNQSGYMRSGKILLHRKIWEDANGPIPKGHVIHHKDHNTLNNDISNLESMTRADHQRHHLKHETVEKSCRCCSHKFMTRTIHKTYALFCSKKCKAKFRRDSGVDDIGSECLNCNKKFVSNKYDRVMFCGPRCVRLFEAKN